MADWFIEAEMYEDEDRENSIYARGLDDEREVDKFLEDLEFELKDRLEDEQTRRYKRDKVLEAVGSEPIATAEVADDAGLPRGTTKNILQELRGEQVAVFDTIGKTRRWIEK